MAGRQKIEQYYKQKQQYFNDMHELSINEEEYEY